MSNIESIPQPSTTVDETIAPASGQADAASSTPPQPAALEGFDRWIKDFQKYESILADMTKASLDTKFKDELTTIEQWFKLLTETERTTALYTLLQHSTQEQVKFFSAALQQMVKPEEAKPVTPVQPSPLKKLSKTVKAPPPSLNLPDLGSPTTPTPITRESAVDEQSHHGLLGQAILNQNAQKKTTQETNLANMVNTPLIPMFQKDKDGADKAALPGFAGINPYTLNMLANAGLSNEAQLLAAQLVMSGLVQPTTLLQQQSKSKKAVPPNWRTPTSARYPASALRSSGLRPTSSLKSAGLKSSGLQSATPLSAVDSPREEDFDPEMLKDIPAWLRTLRLHKYTQCFEGLPWEEMVTLDDAALEARGVAALGARRRLLRTFEHVRKRMGMEDSGDNDQDNATPTMSAVPLSALLKSKLSVDSPVFTPTWEAKAAATTSPVVAEALPVVVEQA